MKFISNVFVVAFVVLTFSTEGQNKVYDTSDSLVVRSIFDEALLRGQSYNQLNYLCKVIGHRITGSQQADDAVEWAQQEVIRYNVSSVSKQSVIANHWVRGDKEWVAISEDVDLLLNACALGGSVGTDGPLQAQVVEVSGMDELSRFKEGDLEGKIVFLNEPMDRSKINTFHAYGACVAQRYAGASEASKYGAVAVLVRSMTTLTDIHPHTGSMGYREGVKKIPAAAISTQDADILHGYIEDMGAATVTMNLNCYTNNSKTYTHNLIAEIKGSENPEQVIVFGAHIDSWDKGEGAHDDGAGVVQCMEVLRLFKEVGIKPKNTIRMVLYMNEENGNKGGKTYASRAKQNGENHICAIETDRGGFSPRGFSIDGREDQIANIAEWTELLEPYGLHYFKKGYGGVDIGPLKSEENRVNNNLMLLGLYPDSQRYFDYHHSETDVFENVNQRELELGGASMASMVYLIDKYWDKFSQ
ncbi:MAG: peptidase M28 family protein [Bacteroidetes bacterium]|nr:MAG: peptidase M28 family protein [Bacteroidota bacterium]